jgi:hypothetical protein
MPDFPVDHCPDVELTKLPDKDIATFDGHGLLLGSVIYFRFAVGPAASEYVVVSDRAAHVEGDTKIMVAGRRGIISAMNPTDFVKDKDCWWEWYQCRYGNPNGRHKKNGKNCQSRPRTL